MAAIQGLLRARDLARRGICLLNAGEFSHAEDVFREAAVLGCTSESLPRLLAAVLQKKPKSDAEVAESSTTSGPAGAIRRALWLRRRGRDEEAITVLRDAVRAEPECAELHFQLGIMLALLGRLEEAELRFTQAANIDRQHSEAVVQLAFCAAKRCGSAESFAHLQAALQQRPFDATIGLLLSRAGRAARERGLAVPACGLVAPAEHADSDEVGIAELSRVIETEPEVVETFLCLPFGEVDESVLAMLLQALERARQRRPDQAALRHYHDRLSARLMQGASSRS